MSEIQQIAETVSQLAVPGMKPKELLGRVRAVHPGASKKDVTRAAFYAVIEAAENNAEAVEHLHDLAWNTRNSLDENSEIEAQSEVRWNPSHNRREDRVN